MSLHCVRALVRLVVEDDEQKYVDGGVGGVRLRVGAHRLLAHPTLLLHQVAQLMMRTSSRLRCVNIGQSFK